MILADTAVCRLFLFSLTFVDICVFKVCLFDFMEFFFLLLPKCLFKADSVVIVARE